MQWRQVQYLLEGKSSANSNGTGSSYQAHSSSDNSHADVHQPSVTAIDVAVVDGVPASPSFADRKDSVVDEEANLLAPPESNRTSTSVVRPRSPDGLGVVQSVPGVCAPLLSAVNQTVNLFADPVTRKPTVLLSAVWFSLAFGFYGMTLWLPKYLGDMPSVRALRC